MIGTALFDEEAYNFNFKDLLGRECLLNVVHEEKNGTSTPTSKAPRRCRRA
jgi:hypothetical protein